MWFDYCIWGDIWFLCIYLTFTLYLLLLTLICVWIHTYIYIYIYIYKIVYIHGFPSGASSQEPTCQCKRHKRHNFYPWVEKIPWRWAWRPPIFLPGEFHGQRCLAGYSPGVAKSRSWLQPFSAQNSTRLRDHLGASQAALVIKNLPANAGDAGNTGSIPGSGRSPGGGHGNLLQYSCLENPMDRGAWWATPS